MSNICFLNLESIIKLRNLMSFFKQEIKLINENQSLEISFFKKGRRPRKKLDTFNPRVILSI